MHAQHKQTRHPYPTWRRFDSRRGIRLPKTNNFTVMMGIWWLGLDWTFWWIKETVETVWGSRGLDAPSSSLCSLLFYDLVCPRALLLCAFSCLLLSGELKKLIGLLLPICYLLAGATKYYYHFHHIIAHANHEWFQLLYLQVLVLQVVFVACSQLLRKSNNNRKRSTTDAVVGLPGSCLGCD